MIAAAPSAQRGRPPWPHVAGCSITGSLHIRRGLASQDAFFAAPAEDGRALVMAVADGAGSRIRSALGAHLAVDSACRVLARAVPDPADPASTWSAWASAAGRHVAAEFTRVAEASLVDSTPDDLATTLVAAVVQPPWTVLVSVGDCFAVVMTRTRGGASAGDTDGAESEACHLVSPPGDPDFLGGAGAGRLRALALWDPGLCGVVLASDGCRAAALDHPRIHDLPPAAGPLPASGFYRELARSARIPESGPASFAALLRDAVADRTVDDATVLGAFAVGPR